METTPPKRVSRTLSALAQKTPRGQRGLPIRAYSLPLPDSGEVSGVDLDEFVRAKRAISKT